LRRVVSKKTMNATWQQLEISLERPQIDEAVNCIFHTLMLHRSMGKFHYRGEGRFHVGTLGTEDVVCDLMNLTYVRLSSADLASALSRDIAIFGNLMREKEEIYTGYISIEFYEKRRRGWPFGFEAVPWEIWMVHVNVVNPTTIHEHLQYRDLVGDSLSEIIFQICEHINRPVYMPKMPIMSELNLVFNTGFRDVQPYLYTIRHHLNPNGKLSITSAVHRLIRGTIAM
ncbi:Autophagy-related protein, partial [Trichinella zimbabwensis]